MLFLAIGMIASAFGLLFEVRPSKNGESHPTVSSVTVSALFPALILMIIVFGVAILMSGIST